MSQQSALITGAAGGLGSAVTDMFLEGGWRVVAAVRPGSAEKVAAGAEPVEVDLTEPAAVTQAVRTATADQTAPLGAVVNLAGGFAAGTRVHETSVTQFESLLHLNLRPTYLVTAAALPHLLAAGGGSVVCVSARATQRPFSGASGYLTAKAAVLAFAGAVAVEYAADGIRCNTVLPGVIDTPANRAAHPDADRSRWVPPTEIARVIHFLAGADSGAITGAAVPVHGHA